MFKFLQPINVDMQNQRVLKPSPSLYVLKDLRGQPAAKNCSLNAWISLIYHHQASTHLNRSSAVYCFGECAKRENTSAPTEKLPIDLRKIIKPFPNNLKPITLKDQIQLENIQDSCHWLVDVPARLNSSENSVFNDIPKMYQISSNYLVTAKAAEH